MIKHIFVILMMCFIVGLIIIGHLGLIWSILLFVSEKINRRSDDERRYNKLL
jgi:hypothetical protein